MRKKKDKNKYKRIIERERKKGRVQERRKDNALIDLDPTDIDREHTFGAGSECSEDMDIPFEEPTANDRRERRTELLRLISGTVALVSLLAAIAITGAAVYIVGKAEADAPTDIPVDTLGDGREDGKIIYVREYDSESGILSAPEIYESCRRSVVSVVCADSEAVGSGFVYSEDGYIVTAAHVIEGANELYVVTDKGYKYEATPVSSDSASDIALLKIDAEGLLPVSFGVSEELLVGERVYAIGTPASLDYAGTFSSGEITYVGREIDIYGNTGLLEKRMSVIQTNAQLNKGNSGCPLFDEYGRVIGMVTMRLGGEYNGIGFALPSDGLSKILSAMKSGESLGDDTLAGVVEGAPALGISGESVERDGIFGYEIATFTECGSDAPSVLKAGDLLVAINGEAVCREADILNVINKFSSGDSVSVTVIRSGQRLTFDIVLGMRSF